MKKKQGRPKETSSWKAMQIREDTFNTINKYQKEQSDKIGITIRKVDLIDVAIKLLVEHKDFIKLAIDFKDK